MAVPAHDTRDYEFAGTFNLPIRVVVSSGEGDALVGDKAYAGEGTIVNSSLVSSEFQLDGLPNTQAAEEIIDWLEKIGKGKRQVILLVIDVCLVIELFWSEHNERLLLFEF